MPRASLFICQVSYLDLTFRFEASLDPGDPGQTSGPPERCWPPEPAGFDEPKIFILGSDHKPGAEVTELAYTLLLPPDSPLPGKTLGEYLESQAMDIAQTLMAEGGDPDHY